VKRQVIAAAGTTAAVAITTGAIFALKPFAPVLSLGSLYVLPVIGVAVAWGIGYALAASVASMLAFNWFFLPPVHTFRLHDAENWFALAVYLVTSVVVSWLATVSRRRTEEAEQREREAALLADVSTALLEGGDVQERLRPLSPKLAEVLHVARARVEIDSLRHAEGEERATRLAAGGRAVGTLFTTGVPPADVLQRLVPGIASLLAVAAERERLARHALDAETLRRSDALKTAILRAVSHDLRTPLTSIRASVEGLLSPSLELSDADRTDLLRTIEAEAFRLQRLVANLLDLSRLEADAVEPRPELWTIDGLIARSLAAVPGSDRVRTAGLDDVPPVRVDGAQIERVLVNLLENALGFSSQDVHVEVDTANDEVRVRITDDGPGIRDDDLERVFEPFEGDRTGLGLAIARGFAQANGGRLWAERSPGGGAMFVLALPAARAPVAVA
jgi:two-component system, OmpR family, sensor histidine kinase KdpD